MVNKRILLFLILSCIISWYVCEELEITEDEEKALIHFHTSDLQTKINMRNFTYQLMARKLKHRQEVYPKYWTWLNITKTDVDAKKKRFLQNDPFSNFTESELKHFEAKFDGNRTQHHDQHAIGRLKFQMKKLRSAMINDTEALNEKIRTLFIC
mgnify:CR=1 FL=1